MHRYEDRKSTNTGRLASECLPNSEVLIRGHVATPSPGLCFDDTTQPLLLFPHPEALPVSQFCAGRPVTLIVPDGNWRQASRVRRRVPGLLDVPCVGLPAGEPSRYRLRAEAHDHGLATIEAIARALGILEGPAVQEALEKVFLAMVERTRWARGEIAADAVASGIPEGAVRHNPRSGAPMAP